MYVLVSYSPGRETVDVCAKLVRVVIRDDGRPFTHWCFDLADAMRFDEPCKPTMDMVRHDFSHLGEEYSYGYEPVDG